MTSTWTREVPDSSRVVIRDITHSVLFNSPGTTQYGIATAVPFANATQITIAIWLRLSVSVTTETILEMTTNGTTGGAKTFWLFRDGNILSWYTQGGGLANRANTSALPFDQWMRVLLTIDQSVASNQVNIYVAGVLNVNARPNNQNVVTGIDTNDMYFGCRGAGAAFPLIGNLIVDRVTIGKAYTVAEALSEYTTARYPTGGTILANYDWTPNNSMTIITDSGTGAKNVTLTNSPVWSLNTPIQAKRAIVEMPYSIDGTTTAKTELADNATIKPASFTIELKVKRNKAGANPNYESICTKTTSSAWNDGWGLSAINGQPNHILRFWQSSYTTGIDFIVPTGEWFSLILTYDSGTTTNKVYVNGALVGMAVLALTQCNGTFCVDGTTNNAYPFNGKIALVRQHSRVLSLTEISFASKNGRVTNGLILDWQYSDGSGGVLTDFSGNSFHGSINVPRWTNDSPCHARLRDIDLGIANQELIIRPDRYVEMIGGAVESVGDTRGYLNRRLARPSAALTTVRPLLSRGSNGRPGLLFDGVNDFLNITWGVTLATPITYMMVYKFVTPPIFGTNDGLIDDIASARRVVWVDPATPFTRIYDDSVGISATYAGAAGNGVYVYAVFCHGGSGGNASFIRVNGVEMGRGTGNLGPGTTGVTMGGMGSGTGNVTRPTNSLLHELRVLSAIPSAAEIATWEAYAKAEWAL